MEKTPLITNKWTKVTNNYHVVSDITHKIKLQFPTFTVLKTSKIGFYIPVHDKSQNELRVKTGKKILQHPKKENLCLVSLVSLTITKYTLQSNHKRYIRNMALAMKCNKNCLAVFFKRRMQSKLNQTSYGVKDSNSRHQEFMTRNMD